MTESKISSGIVIPSIQLIFMVNMGERSSDMCSYVLRSPVSCHSSIWSIVIGQISADTLPLRSTFHTESLHMNQKQEKNPPIAPICKIYVCQVTGGQVEP